MGSATLRLSFLALVLALCSMGFGPAMAQDGAPAGPTQLWAFDPPGAAVYNDVAMDARGLIIAGVAGNDPSITNFDDDEVFVWDLSASKTSRDPVLQHDPRGAITAPEGLGVVAVAPRPGEKADIVAVGREGTQAGDQNRIYLYQISRGPETNQLAKYPNSNSGAPSGAVQGLWFSESGKLLLAQHVGALSLLKQDKGTTFEEVDRWTVPSGEAMTAISVSRDLARIVVATTQEQVGPDKHRLHVRSVANDKITQYANTLVREKDGDAAFSAVDISEEGDLVVAGTEDRVLFYYQLKPDGDRASFSVPWSRALPGAVSAVAIADNGFHFAAGSEPSALHVYRQTKIEDEGPLAERAAKGEFSTGGTVRSITFANNDTALFVRANALYGFNSVQFAPDKALEALWTLPGVDGVAIARDGNRFAVMMGQRIEAYEQSYEATLTTDDATSATPGDTLSLEVLVENTGSAFDEYALAFRDAPGSWSVDVRPDLIQLLPGEGRTVRVNITPSQGHPPGDVVLAVQALSRFAPGDTLAGELSLTIAIGEVHAASVVTDETDFRVTRGSQATFTAILANVGNVEEEIVLDVRQERNWEVTLDEEVRRSVTYKIKPGGDRTVTIALAVPTAVAEGSTNQVTLRARPSAGGTADEAALALIVEPTFGAAISGPTEPVDAKPGEAATFDVTISNAGNTDDTLTVRVFSNATNEQQLWDARASNTNFEMSPGQERTVTITVPVPRGAVAGEAADVTVTVHSAGSGFQEDAATFRVQVPEATDDSPLPLVLVPLALIVAGIARRRRV